MQRIVESFALSTGRRLRIALFTWVVRDAAMRKVPLAVVSVLDLPMAARVRGVPMPMPPSYLRARRTRRARPSMTLFGPSRPVRRRLGGW